MNSFVTYHCHSDYSLLDSCTKFSEYIELAKRDGCKAIGVSEHGMHKGWSEAYFACKNAGVKLLIGCEIYLTEHLEPKVRDNYHTVLIAKNEKGRQELNELVGLSSNEEHMYYTNRISFDEFLNISDNIIKTSACLASPLNQLPDNHPMYMKLAKHYDFLEVQPHNCQEQIDFNRRLLFLSEEIGVPLIAGTDTHNSTPYKAECRKVLLCAKSKSYGNEDSFNLNWRTYDELVREFAVQGVLPESSYLQAIENTNLLADMVEDYDIDTSIKYPILYGSKENDEKKFIESIESNFRQKLEDGIIPESQKEAFESAIEEEVRVFKKLNMCGFILSMSELISWCKDNNISTGPARGSVGGSRVAYVLNVIDMNPETWKTIFSRFCNESRVEVGDIDTDVIESDRPAIFNYISSRFGERFTARVASFGTIAEDGYPDEVCRAFRKAWKNTYGSEDGCPWTLDRASEIKKEYALNPAATKQKYEEIFRYFDGIVGVKDSQSIHPAGMVISPIDLNKYAGVFIKDGERCLLFNMDDAHDLGLVKYDFLVLKTVQLIRDTCAMVNEKYPCTHSVDFNDENVWNDMITSPVGIFQMESSFAFQCLKRMTPKNIFDMSLVTASIRPSGASYRDELLARHVASTPSPQIEELLKNNYGFLVYQEDIIAFLQKICGLSGSDADSVRRYIAKKDEKKLAQWLPKILEGYCKNSDKPREEAEEEAKAFLKVIEDASAYSFGYNHSIAYCLLGYYCAYYRYYHTAEFCATSLNIFQDDQEKTSDIIEFANSRGINVLPPKFGHSGAEYTVDKNENAIHKGVASIKYMNASVANALFDISHKKYNRFMDLLKIIKSTGINARQLEILIRLDYFSDFGNSKELMIILSWFDYFKQGELKQISCDKVSEKKCENLIAKYSTNLNAQGKRLKTYRILDIDGLMAETEDMVKSSEFSDYSFKEKANFQNDVLGYVDIVTNDVNDRRKLLILGVYPMRSKDTNEIWGYTAITRSVGSGKQSRLTVRKNEYDNEPFQKGDVIHAVAVSKSKNGKYWYLDTFYIEI